MGVQNPVDDGAPLRTRLRWKMRGALLWPLFCVMTVVDAALLHWLPMTGTGTGWIPGLLLSGCLNLVAIAALGRMGGWLLRRRRTDLPKVVAEDYAGRVLLGTVTAVFLTVGVVHRGEIEGDRVDFAAQSEAVRLWVDQNGDAFTRAHVDRADTFVVEPDLFRTCVPSPDPRRFTCVYVDTTKDPPTVRADRNRESNTSMAGPIEFR